MEIKCAWCGESQGFKPPLDDTRISHTICKKCREVVLGEINSTQGEVNGNLIDPGKSN